MAKTLTIKGGYEVIVDDDLYPILAACNWHARGSKEHKYAAKRAPRGQYLGKPANFVLMHRIIVNAPDGMFVDHINRNSLDNRRENLRLVTIAENNANASYRRDYLEVEEFVDEHGLMAAIAKYGGNKAVSAMGRLRKRLNGS